MKLVNYQQFTKLKPRVESGSDDLDYLGHLGHFLVGQMGFIHKLNYLDVTRILIDHMFFGKRHWLISE